MFLGKQQEFVMQQMQLITCKHKYSDLLVFYLIYIYIKESNHLGKYREPSGDETITQQPQSELRLLRQYQQ